MTLPSLTRSLGWTLSLSTALVGIFFGGGDIFHSNYHGGEIYFRVDKKKREERRKKEKEELEREAASQEKQSKHIHTEAKKVAAMTKDEHSDQP